MKTVTILLIALALALPAAATRAETFPLPLPGEDIVGALWVARPGAEDTLLDIAYRHGYGYAEILLANPGIDPWLPGEFASVVLPGRHILPDAPRQGIVINIPEMRLYHFPLAGFCAAREVTVYPIGIGKMGWRIPETLTYIAGKLVQPTWQVPASIREEKAAEGEILPAEIPPGPGNPLGEYALQLGLPNYLIHGSNKKYGIGMRVSHGCIRLYPDNIRELFQRVTVGTPVRIVNQPYKAGWQGGRLYLEAHPPLAEQPREGRLTAMVAEVIRSTRGTNQVIDWDAAIRVVDEAKGIPQPIGTAQGN